MEPIKHVDNSPDGGYALRILRAYRQNCDCFWGVRGLDDATSRIYDMMNEDQKQRAVELDKAIRILGRAGGE